MRALSNNLNTNNPRRRNVILPSDRNILTIRNVRLGHMKANNTTKSLRVTNDRFVANLDQDGDVVLNLNVIKDKPLDGGRHRVLNLISNKVYGHMLFRQHNDNPDNKDLNLNTHVIRRTVQRNLRRFDNVVQRDHNLSNQLNKLNQYNNLLLTLGANFILLGNPAQPCRDQGRYGGGSSHDNSRCYGRLTVKLHEQEILDVDRNFSSLATT